MITSLESTDLIYIRNDYFEAKMCWAPSPPCSIRRVPNVAPDDHEGSPVRNNEPPMPLKQEGRKVPHQPDQIVNTNAENAPQNSIRTWRSPKSFQQRMIAAGFIIATLLLAFLFVMSYRANSSFVLWNSLVVHTREVLDTLDKFSTDVKNGQIAAVDYYSNGSEQQVKVFEGAQADAHKTLVELRPLLFDNPTQIKNLDTLSPLADQAWHLLGSVIQLHREGKTGADGLKSVNEEARRITPPLIKALADMISEENHLLETRTAEAGITATRARRLQVAGGISAVALLIFICLLFLRETSIRTNVEGQLEETNSQLEQRIAERTSELEKALQVVRKQNEEPFRLFISNVRDYAILILDKAGNVVSWNIGAERIKGYCAEEIIGQHFSVFYAAEDVEQGKAALALKTATEKGRSEDEGWRVRKDGSRFWASVSVTALRDEHGELHGYGKVTRDMTERKRSEEEMRVRTAQLEISNKELEAFCYSVSHDLRAPLRAIDGFSQAVIQDSGDQLDSRGKEHLKRVCAATHRMGVLIDDLLNLSRISRADMRFQTVDLSQLANEIARDLHADDPARKAEFVIAKDLRATGDPHLVQVVLQNLIGNSWKFASKQELTRIEIGRNDSNGSSSFYVADNGAGFDPAHADRLFGAFQRLHSVSEFPGTGVGLATVQRIINRHGGKIWADAEVDRGATFHFTLQT
jgi:PAS domain S-box-containing protein